MLIYDIFMFGMMVVTILILLTFIMSLWVWVPFVPTPNKVVDHMIKLAGFRGDETVYDLGCGDARMLIAAKKKHPGIKAIGYELPIGVWMLAELRVLFSRQKVDVRLGDFCKADVSDADIMLIYLVPEVMNTLKKKFDVELKKGTKVISHGFAIPGKEHVLVERCELPSWNFLKPPKQKGPRVFVYEW
ncbi:SAM-dependent methyltransferase [Candidatus Peribacteria bacterium]|jgi:hypothetical protein|nr:SAM-dependent methyltransferase [Candidatus Peribacteria bacterium]MBT4020948.1 SAM-dependent methyltransferase [Candidatus Peribacteria bacterium]MBT4240298.1 SAM-dependent methyltransferase [Candidatus Peribacteria bacterium]MBT4473913.1 SAM-dependent methyltransferase [Candidatus Peribacteria bacterium]